MPVKEKPQVVAKKEKKTKESKEHEEKGKEQSAQQLDEANATRSVDAIADEEVPLSDNPVTGDEVPIVWAIVGMISGAICVCMVKRWVQ